MTRMRPIEIMDVFSNARSHPEGVSHVTVTMTQGGPIYDLQHLDGGTEERRALFFHIPLSGRSEQDAERQLHQIFGKAQLYPHFSLHEGRIYLSRNNVPDEIVRDFLSGIKWLTDDHRSAVSQLNDKEKFPYQLNQTTVYGRNEYSYTVFFHKDFRTVQQRLAEASFMVMSANDKPIGTAFAVVIDGSPELVSCGHLGRNGEIVKVKLNNGTLVRAQTHRDTDTDLSILVPIDAWSPDSPLEIGSSLRCELGDTIYVCGFPSALGTNPTLSKGHVSKINAEYKGETNLLQISSAAINPNNSGGPVADFEGNVIGVLTTRAAEGATQNVAFAEPIEKIFSLVQTTRKQP